MEELNPEIQNFLNEVTKNLNSKNEAQSEGLEPAQLSMECSNLLKQLKNDLILNPITRDQMLEYFFNPKQANADRQVHFVKDGFNYLLEWSTTASANPSIVRSLDAGTEETAGGQLGKTMVTLLKTDESAPDFAEVAICSLENSGNEGSSAGRIIFLSKNEQKLDGNAGALERVRELFNALRT